jgi:Protein of unknown function (DUF2442)
MNNSLNLADLNSEISEASFQAANARAKRKTAATPLALRAAYDTQRDRVVITFKSNLELSFDPRITQGLSQGNAAELAEIEVSPSGMGLHFPKLDADVYVPSLLKGITGSQSWMASLMGAAGGKARSSAKTESSRANGAKGGRPRRVSLNNVSPLVS